MSERVRLSAREVERRLRAGTGTLLVCAYEGDAGFQKFPLPHAIALPEFRARLAEVAKAAEIVFYCRCPNDKTAVERAKELGAQGWTQAKVLAGGFGAALAAGLR